MAQDEVDVMAAVGFRRFTVVGHDRGGRVAHRMALDHPERVERVAVLDIAPTHRIYRSTTAAFALDYWHWFFLPQPYPLPERLIGGDPRAYLERALGKWASAGSFAPEALAEYRRCFCDPAAIHASCEDYRAAATIDLRHDEADLDRKLECPLLALWGLRGVMERHFDVLATWRERAVDVRGEAFDCGHYVPEEAPEETVRALLAFLADSHIGAG
jgi:haloacetate dehalogenase